MPEIPTTKFVKNKQNKYINIVISKVVGLGQSPPLSCWARAKPSFQKFKQKNCVQTIEKKKQNGHRNLIHYVTKSLALSVWSNLVGNLSPL